MKATKDTRGGSDSKLELEMVDDLIYIAVNKSPRDFEFTCHTWTAELLSVYIERTFGVKVSGQTIRVILHAYKISYKRSQPKPTKAITENQEAFKKI
ncbi:MAG: hypothetical protein K0R69_3293 [Clostridia bacterium]|nr:hypothetical protein [Clostridia bacterium]